MMSPMWRSVLRHAVFSCLFAGQLFRHGRSGMCHMFCFLFELSIVHFLYQSCFLPFLKLVFFIYYSVIPLFGLVLEISKMVTAFIVLEIML